LESVWGQAIATALSSTSMALDVERRHSELDELQAELEQLSAPSEPGLDLWRHKLSTLISEILDPNHALAIRLAGIRWHSRSTLQLGSDDETFRRANSTFAVMRRCLPRLPRPGAGR
jgi:PhoPQ-activated pathogenicity-related protein